MARGKLYQHGLDKVTVLGDAWTAVMEKLSMQQLYADEDPFCWRGPDLEVIATHDPRSGAHYSDGLAQPHMAGPRGFIMHVGLEGQKEKVLRFLRLLKNYGTDWGGESKGTRDYI